jgi:hypothetical protein
MPAASPLTAATVLPPVTVRTQRQGKSAASVTGTYGASAGVTASATAESSLLNRPPPFSAPLR